VVGCGRSGSDCGISLINLFEEPNCQCGAPTGDFTPFPHVDFDDPHFEGFGLHCGPVYLVLQSGGLMEMDAWRCVEHGGPDQYIEVCSLGPGEQLCYDFEFRGYDQGRAHYFGSFVYGSEDVGTLFSLPFDEVLLTDGGW
jgi:hypothetical protein